MRSILFLSIILSSFAASGQNSWMQMDSINGPGKSGGVSFVIDSEGYIVTGLADDGFKKTMYSYDSFQDDWDDEEILGGANGGALNRGNAAGFSIGNKAYITTGQGNTNAFFKDTWEYDSSSQTWSQKADFEGTARTQAVGFSIDSLGYVGTGLDINGVKADFYKYSPATNTWTTLNNFPGGPRKLAVGFTMGGQAYVGTGDNGTLLKDFYAYEPTIDTWIQKADFPGTPRSGATGWGIFPSAFIGMGYDNTFSYTSDIWEWNYFGEVWIQRADFPASGRTGAMAFVLYGAAYVGGGFNGNFHDDLYVYQPILNTEEKLSDFKISVYPNPTTDFVQVKIHDNEVKQFKLYSISGELIQREKLINSTQTINFTNVTNGIYLIQFTDKNNEIIHSEKIIKN